MVNTKSCSESETKVTRCIICPLLHSAPRKMRAYKLPIAQFIDTVRYCEQKSSQLFKHSFFFFPKLFCIAIMHWY